MEPNEVASQSVPVIPQIGDDPATVNAQLAASVRQAWERIRRLEEKCAALEKQLGSHAVFLDG